VRALAVLALAALVRREGSQESSVSASQDLQHEALATLPLAVLALSALVLAAGRYVYIARLRREGSQVSSGET